MSALHRKLPFILALLGVSCVSGALARAANVKVPLARDAVVQGQAIYLSDLLAEPSPDSLRVATGGIRLGVSPRPGSVRVFSGEAIRQLLEAQRLEGILEVPDRISVRRAGHSITSEEVSEAIHTALIHNENLRSLQISSIDIRLSAPIITPSEATELRVTRIEPDATLNRINAWLVPSNQPNAVPFMVTVPVAVPINDRQYFSSRGTSGASRIAASRSESQLPVLVRAGSSVRLHIAAANGTQMYLTAVALEAGTAGQRVRVRLQGTGRVLRAKVVGPSQLEAEL